MRIAIFTDQQRGSYGIIGRLYRHAFERMGAQVEEIQTPIDPVDRARAASRYRSWIVLHNTLGQAFEPLNGAALNIAVPAHEWSRYPNEWASLLNRFDEIWALSHHIEELLRSSGVTAPIRFAPPAMDLEAMPRKTAWESSPPFRFLFCGEPHFRKGHHLLMQGFQKAFPRPGEAELTIKTSPDCAWHSPRRDIVLMKRSLKRDQLLDLYVNSDCYVSASLGEGLGLPVAEAILAGLPVATNHWGGHKSLLSAGSFFQIAHTEVRQPFCSVPEYYADGQTCALSDPDEVASALRSVVESDSGTRARLAGQARAALVARYGFDAFSDRIARLRTTSN